MKTGNSALDVLIGDVMENDHLLSVEELCQSCFLQFEQVLELVHEGVLDPAADGPGEWHFTFSSVRRVRTAQRLQRDLGVNLAGAALALDLLDRLTEMEQRLRQPGS